MDVRQFLGHLIVEKKLSPGTVNSYSSAIRFFFAVTLNRTMNYLQIPRIKAPKKLPEILTREEIESLIRQGNNRKHKALLLLAYGSGLRANELASLKTKDIDSNSMRVFVRGGKGKKDRYTILSENALHALRDYWRKYRPKSPEGYLFPGLKNVGHITADAIGLALDKALSKTDIDKKASPHTLRHCFVTHMLEDGYSLFQIKEMLGHSSLSSTTVYLVDMASYLSFLVDHNTLSTPDVFLPVFSVTRFTARALAENEWVSRCCRAFTLFYRPPCIAFTIRAWSFLTFCLHWFQLIRSHVSTGLEDAHAVLSTLICFSPFKSSPSFLVIEHLLARQHAFTSGQILNPYPLHYSAAFASCFSPIPHIHRSSLRLTFPYPPALRVINMREHTGFPSSA